MARIEGEMKISQVGLLELRLVLGGPHPTLLARFGFMDDSGTTYGETRLEAASTRSLKILDLFKQSIERDLVDVLTTGIEEEESSDLDLMAELDAFNPLLEEENEDL